MIGTMLVIAGMAALWVVIIVHDVRKQTREYRRRVKKQR